MKPTGQNQQWTLPNSLLEPDAVFSQKIMFIGKLGGFINKQNCPICQKDNPHLINYINSNVLFVVSLTGGLLVHFSLNNNESVL